jgi:hypothetical protein
MHWNSAYTTPVMANGVFYLATKDRLLAITDPAATEGSPGGPAHNSKNAKNSQVGAHRGQ